MLLYALPQNAAGWAKSDCQAYFHDESSTDQAVALGGVGRPGYLDYWKAKSQMKSDDFVQHSLIRFCPLHSNVTYTTRPADVSGSGYCDAQGPGWR